MTNQESQTVEYKQNWHNEYLKVVSAFANSRGGVLYIGLDDHGKSSGLKNVKKLLEDIPNTIRNKLGIIPSVELNRKSSQDIIKITVVPFPTCRDTHFLQWQILSQERKHCAGITRKRTG